MRHTFRSFTKIASRFGEGANHAGEFIRRYSPRQYEWRPDDTNHAGEFIRRYSPVTSPHHVHIAFLNHHPMPHRGRM